MGAAIVVLACLNKANLLLGIQSLLDARERWISLRDGNI